MNINLKIYENAFTFMKYSPQNKNDFQHVLGIYFKNNAH